MKQSEILIRRSSVPTKIQRASYRKRFGWFILLTILLTAVFNHPLLELMRLAKTDLHSHTLLVPFISGYLIYVNRHRFAPERVLSRTPAMVTALLAVILVIIADGFVVDTSAYGTETPTSLLILSFLCLVISSGFLCFGLPQMRAVKFPIAFLFFMVPIPGGIAYYLERWLKLASASAAAWIFDLTNTPVLHDGVYFHLPGITIEVAQECSGIHSTYVLLMTSLVAAYLFLSSSWRRIILVITVVPLGIIRNGFRIFLLGQLCIRYGPTMLDTWIHHHGGPIFFVPTLIILLALLYWLRVGQSATVGNSSSIQKLPTSP